MADRPIIFSGPMVRAILADTKSQTRRVIKSGNGAASIYAGERDGLWIVERFGDPASAMIRCPYHVGTRPWVRETWCPVDDSSMGEGEGWIDYRATPRYSAEHPAGWHNAPDDAEALKWRPSIFMPRWASRITLEVTDVRVQRVQEISEDDAQAEGAKWFDGRPINHYGWRHDHGDLYETAYSSYAALWDSINTKPGHRWGNNPWVWAITFRRVDDTGRADGGSQSRDAAMVEKETSNG